MSKRRLLTIALLLAIVVVPIVESTRVDARPAYCTFDDQLYDQGTGNCTIMVTVSCPWYSDITAVFGIQSCTSTACTMCR